MTVRAWERMIRESEIVSKGWFEMTIIQHKTDPYNVLTSPLVRVA